MDITSISAMVAAGGVLIGIAFAYMEVRNLGRQRETDVETRQAQLFMQISAHYYEEDFRYDETEILFNWKWKDYDDFMEKYGVETNPEAFAKWDSVGTYYKGVGVLVKRGLVDIKLVEDMLTPPIVLYWEKFGPIIKGIREQYNLPDAWKWTEYLYNEMQRREQTLQTQQQ